MHTASHAQTTLDLAQPQTLKRDDGWEEWNIGDKSVSLQKFGEAQAILFSCLIFRKSTVYAFFQRQQQPGDHVVLLAWGTIFSYKPRKLPWARTSFCVHGSKVPFAAHLGLSCRSKSSVRRTLLMSNQLNQWLGQLQASISPALLMVHR